MAVAGCQEPALRGRAQGAERRPAGNHGARDRRGGSGRCEGLRHAQTAQGEARGILPEVPSRRCRARAHSRPGHRQEDRAVSFLLDTAVVSELVRKAPSAAVLKWIDGQDETSLHLSVLTIGELEKGVARLPASARRTRLLSWVRRDLVERFGGRLLAIDARTATQWGALAGESERRGRPLPVIDSLIAATALVHGFAVVTRNVEDFERCGATCVNPWDE